MDARDKVPGVSKPIGHPSYPLDEVVVLRMLLATVTEFTHALADERNHFPKASIVGMAYITEYIGERLEAYEPLLKS